MLEEVMYSVAKLKRLILPAEKIKIHKREQKIRSP